MTSNITRTVSTDQIIGASPAGSPPAADLDDVSTAFFTEGWRQEAAGCYAEARPIFRGSFDRLPRHQGPMVLLIALVLVPLGAGVAWWNGWQAPAQWHWASAWQTVLGLAGR
jgi:hypothetical protein